MFYYTDRFPKKGTIVIAQIDKEKEIKHCVYVVLPEYNNITGIIYQNELPKRYKQQKKAISDMRQSGHIVCVVTSDPNLNADNNAEIVELSIKGVDAKYHSNILARNKNIERLLKILTFVSIKFNLQLEAIARNFRKKIIRPLFTDTIDIDENDGVDNYDELYKKLLCEINTLVNFMAIEDQAVQEDVLNTLKGLIKKTNASTSLPFDLFIWKGNSNDAVYILRNLFSHLVTEFKDRTVEIRYIGAPRYQIYIKNIALEEIDKAYSDIENITIKWINENGVDGYDLRFDKLQKEIVYGDVSITFPFQINL